MPVRAIDGVLSLSHPAQPQPLLTPPATSPPAAPAPVPPLSFRLAQSLAFIFSSSSLKYFLGSNCYKYSTSAALSLLKSPSQPPSFPALPCPLLSPNRKAYRSLYCMYPYVTGNIFFYLSSAKSLRHQESSPVHPDPDNIFKHETHSPPPPDPNAVAFYVGSEQENKFKINSCAQAGYPLMQALQPLSL